MYSLTNFLKSCEGEEEGGRHAKRERKELGGIKRMCAKIYTPKVYGRGGKSMGIIRRCTSHGGACVGVEGTSQKHISTKQKRIV